jgi:hypothetical protein
MDVNLKTKNRKKVEIVKIEPLLSLSYRLAERLILIYKFGKLIRIILNNNVTELLVVAIFYSFINGVFGLTLE